MSGDMQEDSGRGIRWLGHRADGTDAGRVAGRQEMITVHAKIFATLRRHQPELKIGEALPVNLSDGATVERLIRQLRLPADEVKVVFVNGIIRLEDHVLSDGDEVGIFPPVGGG